MRAGCSLCYATNLRAACENAGMNSATIVQKLWNYCNVLRDDGMSYGDYVGQLTCPRDRRIDRIGIGLPRDTKSSRKQLRH